MGVDLKTGPGRGGFSDEYWKENYSSPMEMDNVGNRKLHLNYIKSFLALEYTDISSLADYGFGLGFLFLEALKTFKPYRAYGLEPSETAYLPGEKRLKKFQVEKLPSMKLKLEKIDLLDWARNHKLERKNNPKIKAYDLGLCTSVFQYLSDDEISLVAEELAHANKILYFSVPTDNELKKQREEVEFTDRFAIRRSREKYIELLSPFFTFVGNRFLESKIHYNEDSTPFSELLFRFN